LKSLLVSQRIGFENGKRSRRKACFIGKALG
jgi:hypothetical protein